MPTSITPDNAASVTTPQSLTCGWTSVFTDLSTTESAGDQVADFTAAKYTARTIKINGGTLIVPRLGYAVATTVVTDQLQLVAWGRRYGDGDEAWQVLRNKSGALFSTISTNIGTTPSSDIKGATYAYTAPDLDNQAWDRCGCDEVFFAIKQGFNGDGTDATTVLQIKVI